MLALKLLTSIDQGSIVAAATFGLPELVGGERNWDYRYTLIRDASLSAATLLRLGFTEEPRKFIEWMLDRYDDADKRSTPEQHGTLQMMYRIDGQSDLSEEVLGNLAGYQDSASVSIGNKAHTQLQPDI